MPNTAILELFLMKSNKYDLYEIADVKIGDEVYFDSSTAQNNYDLFWEVHGKDNLSGKVFIRINYLGQEVFWTVHYSEIRQLQTHNNPNRTKK